LWISQIARALPGLDAVVDVAHDCYMFCGRHLTYLADGVAETVTNEYVVSPRFFLIHALAHLIDGESLLAIKREVNNRAGPCFAE